MKDNINKHLDNIIIDGLLKEWEQDNADFEAALRRMSRRDFDELLYGKVDNDENRRRLVDMPLPDEMTVKRSEEVMKDAVVSECSVSPFMIDTDNDSLEPVDIESEEALPRFASPAPPVKKGGRGKLFIWIIALILVIALILIIINVM